MRIYISADIEGVGGVSHPEQTAPGTAEYERARMLMTEEINALVAGALEGGADEVWVADSHGTYRNLVFEHLHPEARLIAGKPRPGWMMAGLENNGPWTGAFLAGYHARAGSEGVLAHTINSAAFALITVDGKAVGETFLSAALAGSWGVPILLISGDDCLARETRFLSGAEVVTVKQALGDRAAVHLPARTVRDSLREAAALAVSRGAEPCTPYTPYTVEGPLWIEVTTLRPVQADAFALVPGVRRLSPTAVGFEAADVPGMARFLNVFALMAGGLH